MRWWIAASLIVIAGAFALFVAWGGAGLSPLQPASPARRNQEGPKTAEAQQHISGFIYRADGSPAQSAVVELRIAFGLALNWETDCTCNSAAVEVVCPNADLAGAATFPMLPQWAEPVARVRVGRSGAFALDVEPGHYSLLATVEGEAGSSLVPSDGQVLLRLAPARPVRIQAWSQVGHGVDADVFLYIAQSQQVVGARSGPDGRVQFQDAPAQDGRVVVISPLHEAGVFPVASPFPYEVRVWLGLPARVSGRVTLHGSPMPGARVSFLEGPCVRRTVTGPDGRYSWPRVPSGQRQFLAQSPAGRGHRQIGLAAGETVDDVDIEVLTPGRVSGVVVDENGRPVAGATVKLTQLPNDVDAEDSELSAATNSTGRFTLGELVPGKYSLEATATGHPTVSRRRPIDVREGFNEEIRVVVPHEARCSTRIVDESGNPIPNAVVGVWLADVNERRGGDFDFVLPEYAINAEANEAGRFSLHGLIRGTYNLVASTNGASWFAKLGVPCSGDLTAKPSPASRPNPADATVLGSVRSESGVPIAGAQVSLALDHSDPMHVYWSPKGSTDSSGRFRIEVPHSTYTRVFIEVPGYDMRVRILRAVTLASGDEISLDLVVPNGNTVTGHVLDGKGSPVPGASVDVGYGRPGELDWDNMNAYTRTDSAGFFQFQHLPTGTMHAAAYRNALFSLDDGKDVDVEPELPDVQLIVAPGPLVRGRVVDEAGVPVRRFQLSGLFFASNDGAFELQLERVGAVELLLSAPGSARIVTPIQATPGSVQELGTIVLPRGTLLPGVVVDADTGQPIGSAVVSEANSREETWTDGDGTFSLTVGPSPSLRIGAKNYETATFETATSGNQFALHALH